MKRFVILFALFTGSTTLFGQTAEFVKIENQIKDHISKGRWDEVVLLAPDLLIEEPTRGEGYYYTAYAMLKMDQPEKATEYLSKAETMADAELKNKISTLKSEVNTTKKAIQIEENAEQKEKGGNKKLAADEWKKLWEMDKTKSANALNAVELYVEEKKFQAALDVLNDPSLARDEGAKALISRLNQTPEMISINGYNTAMKAGKSEFDNGNYQTAITKFDKALSYRSSDPDATQYKKRAQDEIAWNTAKSTNTIQSFETYVNGSTIRKHKDEAIAIIKRSLIKWGEQYANENNIAQTEYYLNKYLSDYPYGDDAGKAKKILCATYFRNANNYKKVKTYGSQKQAIDYFTRVKNLCPADYSLEQPLKTANRMMTRYGRPDRTYIAYVYDSITPYGISIGGLKNRKVGMYISWRMNKDLMTKSAYYTVDNSGNFSGTSLTDLRMKNEKRNGQGEALIGLTKKITYPLWVYAGGGIVFTNQWVKVDSYYSNGDFNETAWVKNTDEKSMKAMAEAGIIIDLQGPHLRAGVESSDFKKMTYTLGIGVSFK